MIHEVGKELQAKLRELECPFIVVDRESTDTTTWGRERIVIEHDPSGDRFDTARSQKVNPPCRMTRLIGAKLTIYAKSAKAGALGFEHRRRAENVLDSVLVGLSEIHSVRQGRGAFIPDSGAFIDPPDLEGSASPGGAVYELKFTVPRAVLVTTFKGDAAPTATIGEGGVTIRNRTRIAGSEETGCEPPEEEP